MFSHKQTIVLILILIGVLAVSVYCYVTIQPKFAVEAVDKVGKKIRYHWGGKSEEYIYQPGMSLQGRTVRNFQLAVVPMDGTATGQQVQFQITRNGKLVHTQTVYFNQPNLGLPNA